MLFRVMQEVRQKSLLIRWSVLVGLDIWKWFWLFLIQKIVSYEKVLEIFWKEIDPTDAGGQFADRGSQYRTAIFYFDETQKMIAENSKTELENQKIFSTSIVTKILPYKNFYKAEEEHQDYSDKKSRSL